MIKSLLGEDEKEDKKFENKPEIIGEKDISVENLADVGEDLSANITTQNDVKTENTQVQEPTEEIETIEEIKTAIETGIIPPKINETPTQRNFDTVKPFEVNKPIGQPTFERNLENESATEVSLETEDFKLPSRAEELEKKLREIEDELRKEKELEEKRFNDEKFELESSLTDDLINQVEPLDEVKTVVRPRQDQTMFGVSTADEQYSGPNDSSTISITQKDFVPESQSENIRKTGMAYSAAIALFGSIIFMLILGWFADLMLDSAPWGTVVGIVIGAGIGFIQFFRITSQIHKPKPSDFDKVSLRSDMNLAEPPVETKVENTDSENSVNAEIPSQINKETNIENNISENFETNTESNSENLSENVTKPFETGE